MKSLVSAESGLTGALSRLMVVSEQYPDLKANQNMMQLTEELTSTENKVSFARQAYNDSVMQYNTDARDVPQCRPRRDVWLPARRAVPRRRSDGAQRAEGFVQLMDFFAAEERAKKRTTRLLLLFGCAVAGTIAAGYLGTVILLRTAGHRAHHHRYYDNGDPAASEAQPFWQPGLFAIVSIGTLAVIGIASLYKWTQFSTGGAAVAESVGGRRVDPHSTDPKEHQLLNVVEEMAIASGSPSRPSMSSTTSRRSTPSPPA